jgi:1-phosphofructokinase
VILTITANPSVDRTVEVDAFARGGVVRARAARIDPGGKGVNVSRALAANGFATCAVLPCGGPEGAHLAALLNAEGVEVALVPIAGSVRTNVSVVEPDGTTTKINEPGPNLTADELEALTTASVDRSADTDWVVISGSLPPGADPEFYGELVARLVLTGRPIALDTSGTPLRVTLDARPTIVKPNAVELAEATGRTISTLGDVVDAAELLREKGAGCVLASLGPDGAVLVDDAGATHGECHVDSPCSSVGAGDALLAGFLATGGRGRAALAQALAWGAAAIALPGSRMPTRDDIRPHAVVIHQSIDYSRPLTGMEHQPWQN